MYAQIYTALMVRVLALEKWMTLYMALDDDESDHYEAYRKYGTEGAALIREAEHQFEIINALIPPELGLTFLFSDVDAKYNEIVFGFRKDAVSDEYICKNEEGWGFVTITFLLNDVRVVYEGKPFNEGQIDFINNLLNVNRHPIKL